MATGNFFNGTFSRRPRVAARVDDTGLIPFSGGPIRTVALIGPALGGQPQVPLAFTSPVEAAQVLVGGDLLTAVRRAFSPSAEFNGASSILAVRVNPATQGALTLKDAGGTVESVVLTSRDYGVKENQIKAKVEAGTNQGKKITLVRGTDLYVGDDLYRAVLSIQYVGAGSAATMAISATALTTTVTGGPGGENLNVAFATYDTLQKLADYIDALPAYTCSVTGSDPSDATAAALDPVGTPVDIKTAPVSILATIQAILDWLNGDYQPLVTGARHANCAGVPANLAYTYLAGGGEGTTDNDDWQACFNAIQGYEVAFVVPVSSTDTLHAMADVHCQLMSADGKRPRRAFVGAAAGEHATGLGAYITRAQNLNSDRTALIVDGVKGYDDVTGLATTFPPYIAAALVAGLQAGLPEIGDAITMKSIRGTGLEWVPSASEIELGIDKGLLMLEFAEGRGFYRVSRGITTWRKNDAYHRVEISVGIALDEVVRRVVTDLEMFLGQKASPITVYRILSRTQTTLIGLQRDGVIVGDAGHPAYRDISVDLDGDTARVQFACSPVLVLNFVNVTVNAEVFSGRVTISTP